MRGVALFGEDAAVPEIAVDKHDESSGREDEVWRAWEGCDADAVTKAACVESAAQDGLGARVAAADARHEA
jgi:hypothetical protein